MKNKEKYEKEAESLLPGFENYVYNESDKCVYVGNDYHEDAIKVPLSVLDEP